jgi:predicted RNA-binding Zn-ribbon protein involved in translation (DUF1610 family)
MEEAIRSRMDKEGGDTSLSPQEVIKEKCPTCKVEISPVKVSSNSRNVVMLCPSCGNKRSRMMTKDGWKSEKQKYDYRFSPIVLYGETYAARSKPLN